MNKKINRKYDWFLLVVWFLLLLVAGYLQAAGTGLNIKFRGTLIIKECVFDQPDGALEVVFRPTSIKYFEHYGKTLAQPFSIGLKNCTADTQNKLVELTFSYPQSEIVNGIEMLKPVLGANTGVVIGLLDDTDKAIIPGEPVRVGVITTTGNGNVNHFTLRAYAMVPPGVKVKAGEYAAITTFTASYQ